MRHDSFGIGKKIFRQNLIKEHRWSCDIFHCWTHRDESKGDSKNRYYAKFDL